MGFLARGNSKPLTEHKVLGHVRLQHLGDLCPASVVAKGGSAGVLKILGCLPSLRMNLGFCGFLALGGFEAL